MFLRPLPDRLKISTAMLRIEVHKRLWMRLILWLPPNLAKDADISDTHQLLPQNVHAMSDMVPDNVLAVRKGTLLQLLVVVVVPLQRLPQQVLGNNVRICACTWRKIYSLTKQCKW